MPRPRQISKVQMPPRVKGFIPLGYYKNQTDPVLLNIEEYEAIRLLDYEGLSQVEASVLMQISRPTLTRIYERARKKVATALTEARQILIEGGNSIFNGNWYLCEKCDSKFNNPHDTEFSKCPLCESPNIQHLED
ncbi:MAG: DUF134 domain-containing protein [Prolixibacteraceae bacterium]